MIDEAVVWAEVKTSLSSVAWSEDEKVEIAKTTKFNKMTAASAACPLLKIAPTLKGFKAEIASLVYFTTIDESDQFQGSKYFAQRLSLGKIMRIGPPWSYGIGFPLRAIAIYPLAATKLFKVFEEA